MADTTSSRRKFLTMGGLFAAGTAFADVCSLTPRQIEGPFYPRTKTTDNSVNDLTVIAGHSQVAKGDVIYITGTVQDAQCRPITGALVEIWQAAESGRYNHPSDTSGLVLDPDFQTWGEFITDSDGRYAFKTIVPGHYPADANWTRPPHVHFKVTKRGYRELITQMYFTPDSFEGDRRRAIDQLNRADLILNDLQDKQSVLVAFPTIAADKKVGPVLAYRTGGLLARVGDLVAPTGSKVGDFTITLRSLR